VLGAPGYPHIYTFVFLGWFWGRAHARSLRVEPLLVVGGARGEQYVEEEQLMCENAVKNDGRLSRVILLIAYILGELRLSE